MQRQNANCNVPEPSSQKFVAPLQLCQFRQLDLLHCLPEASPHRYTAELKGRGTVGTDYSDFKYSISAALSGSLRVSCRGSR
jgi:hypothetical protein